MLSGWRLDRGDFSADWRASAGIEQGEEVMKHAEGFLALVADAKSRIREVSPEEVTAKVAHGDAFYFIDVREDHEWSKDHCAGAIHLGKGIIERDIENTIPDRDADIVLYCGGGFRSALAADALRKMGYKNVLSMAGGIGRWRELGYPLSAEP
jgi:rhodanese-related sulfurtransferase